MLKYCFILDEETGLVQLGAGCDEAYYIEIGMQLRDVEQSEIDDAWYLSEKCPHYSEEEKEQIEKDRINNLEMTALDFIKVLEGFGLDYVTEIKTFLENHQDLDKQLKYCQNVWCGVAKQVFATPIIIGNVTITSQMIEQAFKAKNGVE